jgi:DNA invertase Pin-like site-specific DNA recombinase
MTRAASYIRISTHEGKQHAENQRRVIVEHCIREGWTVPNRLEFRDEESGARADRPALRRMMAAAAARKFDVVVVFDLSRLTREGPLSALRYIERLKKSGVEFASATEPIFSSSGPAGDLFIALAAWIAREERKNLRARVQAGLDRARAAGTRLGRPRLIDFAAPALAKLRGQGLSIPDIAELTKLSRSTIERRLRQYRKEFPNPYRPKEKQ